MGQEKVMPEEAQLEDFTEGVHLETADGPKPIVEWGTPGAPDPIQQDDEAPVDELPEPQVYNYGDGSSVTIEQPELTGRGWRATADSGTGKPAEVFYGKTKDELLQNVLVGKMNATRKINELKRKALLETPVNEPQAQQEPTPAKPNRLNANDVFDIKAKLEENPDLAMEEWFQKRTGKSLEELMAILESSQTKANAAYEVSEDNAIGQILTDWVDTVDDYVVDIQNRDAIIAWLLKFKARVSPARFTIESGLSHLYQNGHLTNDNLDAAWEDLKEEGQAILNTPAPAPVPVAPGNRRPRNAGFNVRSNGGTVTTRTPQVPEKITQADLDKMSDDEIKTLYHGILEMRRTPVGHRMVQEAVERIREKK